MAECGAVLALLLWSGAALSHGGGLNADGCHFNRTTGEYHCHRIPAAQLHASPLPLLTPSGATTCASAEVMRFEGKVVGVSDGDSIIVVDSEKKRIRVHLDGIDAPERGYKSVPGQSYARKAHLHLSELVKGKHAVIVWHKQDKYYRIIGRVSVDGMDIGLAQLQAGFAWVYVEYIGEVPEPHRTAYLEAEKEARAAGVGLWKDSAPVPPWDWRAAMRETAGQHDAAPEAE